MYHHENRLLKIKTPLPENTLLATGLSGSEHLFGGFCFIVEMISTEKSILAKNLLHQPLVVEVSQSQGVSRYFHGWVSLFERGNKEEQFYRYLAEIRPQLWFLSLTRNYRIFQQQTVPDILKVVLQEAKIVDVEFKLKRAYAPREYCCQFGESLLDFVHRLLEEEGIFYFYEHEATRHKLVFMDEVASLTLPKGFSAIADSRDDFAHWYQRDKVQSGKFVLTDYCHETPGTLLQVSQDKPQNAYEIHQYPGKFSSLSTGKSKLHLHHMASENQASMMGGQIDDLCFAPGNRFQHAGKVFYLLTTVYQIHDKSYCTSGSQSCQMSFTCLPIQVPYIPPTLTPKPIVSGVDTAVVIGDEGSDIFTDSQGRVKVKFHWDREAEGRSCWLRVAQLWAGQSYGTQFLPRVGQEVIVQFVHGDPDRPLIMGTLFNADHPPAFKLPEQQTRSGIKTRSIPQRGQQVGNEFSFEDAKGQEEILLHAQKDFKRIVEDSEWCVIKKGNLHISLAQGEAHIEAKQRISLKVGDSKIELGEEALSIFSKKVIVK